jgi:hypothetical protein
LSTCLCSGRVGLELRDQVGVFGGGCFGPGFRVDGIPSEKGVGVMEDSLSGLHAPVSEEVFAASPVLGAVRDHVRVLEAAARDRDRLVNTTLQTGPLDLDVHVDTDTGVCINGMDLRVVGLGLIQLAMRLPTLTPGTSHTVIASDRPDRSDPPPAAGTGVVSVWLRELVGSLDALVSAATAAQVHAEVMLEAQVRSEARQAGIAHKEAGPVPGRQRTPGQQEGPVRGDQGSRREP